MLSTAVHLLPYAIVAMLSPLGFAATIAVMETGRLQALGFGLGVVFGQLAACTLLVALGSVTRPDTGRSHPTFQGLLELGAGLGLLWLAALLRRRPELMNRGTSGRAQAALDRLHRVHTITAVGVGVLLGIGGPKRLVLTALAAATITASGQSTRNAAALVGWYSLLATVLVWVPVLAYLFLGTFAVAALDAALQWLARNRRPATLTTLVVVGAVLVLDGVVLLL